MKSFSFRTRFIVCSLEFGESEREQFNYQMDYLGGVGGLHILLFFQLFCFIESIIH